MYSLFPGGAHRPLREVLCIGAHSDDIEIGCAGTLQALCAAHPGLRVHWVVCSADAVRADEARVAADRVLAAAGHAHIAVESFRDGYFPAQFAAIKDYFEALRTDVNPDIVFTHYRSDRHQDHRTLSDLTWNTFRNHLVLEYEIPKYDGDLGRPNVYVPLTEKAAEEKVALLLESFASQHDHPWFERSTFSGLMRMRGVECNAPEGFAEAFHGRKLVLRVNGDDHGC